MNSARVPTVIEIMDKLIVITAYVGAILKSNCSDLVVCYLQKHFIVYIGEIN